MWLTVAPLFLGAAPAPADRPVTSLYAVEAVSDKGTLVTGSLVRIATARDDHPTKVTLVSLAIGFYSHIDGPRLMRDRFLVTRYGGVIDLMTGKVVNGACGELLGFEGRKVVYRVTDDRRDTGVFTFDLKTSRVEKLADPGRWGLPGMVSPDGKKSVESKMDGTIILHTLDGAMTELGRDHIWERSTASSLLMGVSCLWLDDTRVLTQKSNGKLVVLNVGGASERLLDIPGLNSDNVFSAPVLRLDGRHQVVYSCGDDYLIDVAKKKWSRMEWYALGHGFEAAVAADESGVRHVRHAGKEIGKWSMNPYEAKTADGRIAFPYKAPLPIFERIQVPSKGVALWEASTGQWQMVDFPVSSLVGWAAVGAEKPDY